MKISTPRLLGTLASLAFSTFAMPGYASTAARGSGGDKAVKIIGGKQVVRNKCEWHNFFQSMNMWPKYRLCPGKSAQESFGFYASDRAPSSVLDVFLQLNRGQGFTVGEDFVRPVGSIQLELRIGSATHRASVCDWYNLFQSRYRTPYYLKCEGRSNRDSFGRFAEPDYPVIAGDNEKTARRAPDISAFLGSAKGAAPLSLLIGDRQYTRSYCEWHNFFASFNPLPRFIVCQGKTTSESFGQYNFGQNIVALNVQGAANGDATSERFGELVSFQLGSETITTKRCALYNWLQSNIRWPIYRGCGPIRQDSFTNADPRVFPKADRRYVYNQNYTN